MCAGEPTLCLVCLFWAAVETRRCHMVNSVEDDQLLLEIRKAHSEGTKTQHVLIMYFYLYYWCLSTWIICQISFNSWAHLIYSSTIYVWLSLLPKSYFNILFFVFDLLQHWWRDIICNVKVLTYLLESCYTLHSVVFLYVLGKPVTWKTSAEWDWRFIAWSHYSWE